MGGFSSTGITARTVGRRSKRLVNRHIGTTLEKATDDVFNEVSLDAEKKLPQLLIPVTPSPQKKKRTLQLNDIPIPTSTTIEDKDLILTTNMIAAINPTQKFIDFHIPPEELRPSNTLTTGQCFHWKVVYPNSTKKMTPKSIIHTTIESSTDSTNKNRSPSAWGTHDATEWVGTLRLRLFHSYESIVVVIRQTPTTTLYRPLTSIHRDDDTINNNSTNNIDEELRRALWDYFQLDTSLPKLYEEWSLSCPRLATIAKCIPGVRIVKQDPWECLVSFICSSNNNIPRITKMLANIRREYGRPLLTIPTINEKNNGNVDDQTQQHYQFYSFPSLEELFLQANEEELRSKCGMGYRANYIIETMKILHSKSGENYFRDVLSNIKDPIELQTRLCEFKGVGRKVADCVALFSLRQDDAIPVDTHVWNIAIRDYDTDGTLKTGVKSLTPTNYKLVGNLFRQRFPNRAGWAHSLLFVAELPSFRGLLPSYITKEMNDFRYEEKERKKKQKQK